MTTTTTTPTKLEIALQELDQKHKQEKEAMILRFEGINARTELRKKIKGLIKEFEHKYNIVFDEDRSFTETNFALNTKYNTDKDGNEIAKVKRFNLLCGKGYYVSDGIVYNSLNKEITSMIQMSVEDNGHKWIARLGNKEFIALWNSLKG